MKIVACIRYNKTVFNPWLTKKKSGDKNWIRDPVGAKKFTKLYLKKQANKKSNREILDNFI